MFKTEMNVIVLKLYLNYFQSLENNINCSMRIWKIMNIYFVEEKRCDPFQNVQFDV